MQETIDATKYRRKKQLAYNKKHNITPKQIVKDANSSLLQAETGKAYIEDLNKANIAADPVIGYMSKPELEKQIQKVHSSMLKAAKEQDYLEAARLRDEWLALQKLLE